MATGLAHAQNGCGGGSGETPAGGAAGFGGGDTEHGVEGEDVEVPGWRAGARCAERGGVGVALNLAWPTGAAVVGGHPLQGVRVGDPDCLAFQDEVDAGKAGGDRAGRVRREVARLTGSRAADEV